MSRRLEDLEEQVQRSSCGRRPGGVAMEELEGERDALKKRRDALDAQLRDNKVLTVEVTKTGTSVSVLDLFCSNIVIFF